MGTVRLTMTRSAPRTRSGRAWVTLVAVLAAFAVGAAAGVFSRDLLFPKPEQSSAPTARAPAQVTALGRLQPAGGVVPVYGPPGDRIEKIYTKGDKPIGPGTPLDGPGPGDKKGDPIADLTSKKQRDLELAVAKTQLDESKDAKAAAEAAGKKKIEAAQAERDQLLASKDFDLAALDAKARYLKQAEATATGQVKRLKQLKEDGVRVADEDLERAELAVGQAKAEYTAAVAARKKAEVSYDEGEKAANARIAAAKEELNEAVAKVPLDSARKRLEVAEHLAGLTTVRAPVGGVVLKVNGREGQPTGLDPILLLAPQGDMVAVAEVYESDLGRLTDALKRGPVAAEVSSPALSAGQPLRGRVESDQDVNRMIAKNQVFALGPREDADRRVVEVVVHLDPESSRQASRYVGLQVTVAFQPQK
jgi:HlyD family secretion protein